jgi:hypothetical protein
MLAVVELSACGFEPSEIGVVPPPLFVRQEGTAPRDSTENLYEARGLPLVVNFNREFSVGEVTHVQLVPRPASLGTLHSPGTSARQLLVERVVLDPVYAAYRLVLDGPAMPEPVILSYYSSNHDPLEGAMIGHVQLSHPNVGPANVIVYALVPSWREAEFELTGAEQRILGRVAAGVTKTISVSTEEGGWFRLAGLELGKFYFALAIIDTNRDGQYDFEVDWWGYYRDTVDFPLEVMAGVWFGALFDPPLPSLNPNVDFWLMRAGDIDASSEFINGGE